MQSHFPYSKPFNPLDKSYKSITLSFPVHEPSYLDVGGEVRQRSASGSHWISNGHNNLDSQSNFAQAAESELTDPCVFQLSRPILAIAPTTSEEDIVCRPLPGIPDFSDKPMFPGPVPSPLSAAPRVKRRKTTAKEKKCGDETHIKRPMNAFMVWAQVQRKKIAKNNPTMHNAEISKRLGRMWKSMSSDEKDIYKEQAKQLKILHMKKYPNYKLSNHP